jgi:hypothetical protein
VVEGSLPEESCNVYSTATLHRTTTVIGQLVTDSLMNFVKGGRGNVDVFLKLPSSK